MTELNLDEDFTDLRTLASLKSGSEPEPSILEAELDGRWREQHNVPETGFRVYPGHGIKSMALWRVSFLGIAAKPGWHHGIQSRLWIKYKHIECIWRGPSAPADHTRVVKGVPVSVYRGNVEQFQFTLLDALVKMQEIKQKHRGDMIHGITSLKASLTRLLEDLGRAQKDLEELDAFDPESILPEAEFEAEELARDLAYEETLHAKNST
jgi:hypothetical protein